MYVFIYPRVVNLLKIIIYLLFLFLILLAIGVPEKVIGSSSLNDLCLGEETESAPEGGDNDDDDDDDAVTRCICDLTHDDGYMICCDRCWYVFTSADFLKY